MRKDNEKNIETKIIDHFDCYPFTHEQAREIKIILGKKFKPESVARFINQLRDTCEGAAALLGEPDFKTYKNDRVSMMATLEKSRQLLDTIRMGGGIYRPSDYPELLDNRGQLALECQELACTTGNLLSILIRKLEHLDDTNQRHMKGRPGADSKGIVAEIARIWEQCFEKKPTTYSEGAFADVVKIALHGLKLEAEDPKRKINAALKQVTKLE